MKEHRSMREKTLDVESEHMSSAAVYWCEASKTLLLFIHIIILYSLKNDLRLLAIKVP